MKKILCMLLSILIIMQILPMSTFAEELNNTTDTSLIDTDTPEEQVVVLSENESKRDEKTKHFLLSDGSYKAVVYPTPVHYQNDNEWIEIDNTLIETEDENDNEYFVPSKSPIDVKFAKHGDSEKLVHYTVNGYEISWSYENGNFGLFKKYSKISKTNNKNNKIKDNVDIPTDVLDKIESKAKYDHFYNNVDIEYTVTSEGVKENVILNKKSAQNVFYIRYNIGKLTAKQTSDRLITLYDGENAVVQIDAPYMIDSNNISSDALSLKIVEQKKGILRVCLTADSEWLNADDREYPVTVDPYVLKYNNDTQYDGTYTQNIMQSDNYPHGSLCVGKEASYGVCRSYIKFDLPTLTAGDMVVGGMLGVWQYAGDSIGFTSDVGATSMRINAVTVSEAWTKDDIRLKTKIPSHLSTVIDSIEVSECNEVTPHTFDIGKAVKNWYNHPNTNFGLMLYSTKENEYTFASFYATESKSVYKPVLIVSYLNNKGLEDRWTYHTQSLGESGTSYINDCTGNLVFVAPVCNTVGNNAPASVTLVYNGYLANTFNSLTTNAKSGYGWCFDFQQKITKISENSALHQAGFEYIYTDADGTEHFFRAKGDNDNICEDEEGMNLTLTVNSDSTYTLKSEKTGAKNIYNANGNILKICDADNNYCLYTYENGKLTKITDGANRNITIGYTTSGYISSVTDPAGRVTSFLYTGSNINKITYPDGAYTKFEYNDNNCLSKCTAIDKT